MESCFDKGLALTQMLPNIKMYSLFNQAQADTTRFVYDCKIKKSYCERPDSTTIVVPSLVRKHGSTLINHNIECRVVFCKLKQVFGMADAPLSGQTFIRRCDTLLMVQSESMREVKNILIKNGVYLDDQVFSVFERYGPDRRPDVLTAFDNRVANMTLQDLDELTGQLGSDIYDQPKNGVLFKLAQKYTTTQKVRGSSSALSSSSSIGALSSSSSIDTSSGLLGLSDNAQEAGSQGSVNPYDPGYI